MAEIVCPNCKTRNVTDAAYCLVCRFPLKIGRGELPTTRQNKEVDTAVLAEIGFDGAEHPLEIPQTGIAVFTWTEHTPIAVVTTGRLILGRSMPGEPEDARMIDLTSFDAIESGVSRRHAEIRQAADGYEIVDLDSTNGTWLEKRRLVPRRAYPLPGVSRIVLGRLHLIALYKSTAPAGDPP